MRESCILLIGEAVSSGSRIKSACKVLGLSVRTFERWKLNPGGDLRKGPVTAPKNKLSASERDRVLQIATSKEFSSKSPAQIVPSLADRGEYIASESTFYRFLKAEKMIQHRGRSKTPQKREKPCQLEANAPNQVYSWDITYLKAALKGTFYYLYFVMDIYSRKIVGSALHNEQLSEHASKLLQKICIKEAIKPDELVLHSDNGAPMKGATMLATLQHLGVAASFSRPATSNDNPYSESLFKTTKYCPSFPSKPFESLEHAKDWVDDFVTWYNTEHLHSGISFVTPQQRHLGADRKILRNRDQVYKNAKKKNPERWSKETRNWERIEKVVLNPLLEEETSGKKKTA